MKKKVAAVFICLSFTLAVVAQDSGDRRVVPTIKAHRQMALVIGNASYVNQPTLINSIRDAQAVSYRLRQLNFDVTLVTDADHRKMDTAIGEFARKLTTGDVALFYYSGHGLQVDGENYLVPVDFQGQDETEVKYNAPHAGLIQELMEKSGARLNILVLDACRDNPYHSSSRSINKGLAAMSAGRGTLIAFATSPGRTASDNPRGQNGLFTQYLLEALSTPGLSLSEVFDLVRDKVDAASDGRQTPWTLSSVVGRYVFSREPEPAPQPAPVSSPAPAAPVTRVPERTDIRRPLPNPARKDWSAIAVVNYANVAKGTKDAQADVQKALEKYAKDNGYDIIYDVSNANAPVLYASSGIDITQDLANSYDALLHQRSAPAGSRGAARPLSAVLSIQGAIVGTKDGQKTSQELDAKFVPKNKEFQARQSEISQLQNQLTNRGAGMGEDKRNQLARDIDTKKKLLERDMQDAEEQLKGDQQRVLSTLGQNMMTVIEKYANANGLNLILDVSNQNTPVLYASSGLDITQDIVSAYDKKADYRPEAQHAAAAPSSRSAVISIQGAIVGTKDGQKASQDLDAKFVPKNREFQARQSEITQLQDQLSKSESAMGEDNRNQLTRDIDTKKKRLERDMQDAEEDLKGEQQKVLSTLGQRMMAVIEKYAKDNGYGLVVDISNPNTPILYASNAVDITNDIVRLYDAAPAPQR